MPSEISIYNRAGLNPRTVQLEALVSASQFAQVVRNGYVRFDAARGIWRLTDAGHAELVAAEIAGERND